MRTKSTEQGETPFIPYGRQSIGEDDIAAVAAVLRSDWLTTGPKVAEFERAVAKFVGAPQTVAVSSGTAALHAVMHAISIGPGDEVVVPAMTFAASANCVVYQGGTPVFADVEPDTLLISPADVLAKITPRTRAVIAVDYAGQPCDYDALHGICRERGLVLVADACHSLGAEYKGQKVGTLADLTVFSFHPVKHITTGEGGIVVTENPEYEKRVRRFRNHGIDTDHRQREVQGTWHYEMVDLGFNYRITDFQCALGVSQLAKLPGWLERRHAMATLYDELLVSMMGQVQPLALSPGRKHAWHLYPVQLSDASRRGEAFASMRSRGIGINVHYLPVHLHPYYQNRFGTGPGLCPVAEAAYERLLSLPMHQQLASADVHRVVNCLREALAQ